MRSSEEIPSRPQVKKESHMLSEQKVPSREFSSQRRPPPSGIAESWDEFNNRRKTGIDSGNQSRSGYLSISNDDSNNHGPSSKQLSEAEYASFQRSRIRTAASNNQALPNDDKESYRDARSNLVDNKINWQGKRSSTVGEGYQEMRKIGSEFVSQRPRDNITREPLRKGTGYTKAIPPHPVYDNSHMQHPANRLGELSRAPRPRIPDDPRISRSGFQPQLHSSDPESMAVDNNYNDRQTKVPENVSSKQRLRQTDPVGIQYQVQNEQHLEESKFRDNDRNETKSKSQPLDPRKDDRQLKEMTASARRGSSVSMGPKDPRLAKLDNTDSSFSKPPISTERFPKDPRMEVLKDFGARHQPPVETSLKDPRRQYHDHSGDVESRQKTPPMPSALPKNKSSGRNVERPWNTEYQYETTAERVNDRKTEAANNTESAELALKSSALSTRHKLNPGSSISDQFRILDPTASSFV